MPRPGLWADTTRLVFSPGKPVDRRLCRATTAPGIYLHREIPFKDSDRAVHINVDRGVALATNIESAMNMIGFAHCAAYRAGLARELLGFFYNAEAFEPGLEGEHLGDLNKRPFVELLVSAVPQSLPFLISIRSPTMIVETPRASASRTRDLVKLWSR